MYLHLVKARLLRIRFQLCVFINSYAAAAAVRHLRVQFSDLLLMGDSQISRKHGVEQKRAAGSQQIAEPLFLACDILRMNATVK